MKISIHKITAIALITCSMVPAVPSTAMAAKLSRDSGPGATQFVSPAGEPAETQSTAAQTGSAATNDSTEAAAAQGGDLTWLQAGQAVSEAEVQTSSQAKSGADVQTTTQTASQAGTQATSQTGTSAAPGTGTIDISVKGLEGLQEVNASSPILGGAALYMLPSANKDDQVLSCLIKAADGTLIVVDGGLGADEDRLKAAIRELGGTVSAWLITHPHGDHAGALYKLLEEEIGNTTAGNASDITIQNIYCSMANREWYQANDPSDGAFSIEFLNKLEQIDGSRLHYVGRGTTIMAGSTKIEVINDRYDTDWNKGNNASICYKIWVNGKSILFLGDMASEGGRRLLQHEKDNLKADIVQMAHHGQSGVEEDVYKAISPTIALWPTPQWLYNQNEDSKYRTSETRAWMRKLGVKNYVVLSSGFVLR